LITPGVIRSQHLCLSPFLSRKVVCTISDLPFALFVFAVDLVIVVAVVAVAVVVVVVVQRVCCTHRNTVTGRRPFFEKFAFSKRGMPS
jgi:ABC-type protease/lipase transport system fused ATPase/permease subunit